MSLINVSELIGDPDFTQPNKVTVIRRKVTIVNHKPQSTNETLKMVGIITIAKQNETEMLETADRESEEIHVFTYKKLYTTGREENAPHDGYFSDLVVFNNKTYRVVSCFDDEQYGFCKSVATLIEQDVV